ncbi:MAG: hypothetical protein U0414_34890 [Polyangiaceae bacterium]
MSVSLWWVPVSFVIVTGCASGTVSPSPAGSTSSTEPAVSATAAASPARTNEPVATDHEFTPNDCEEMGRKYHDLHASDLRKTMKPGLTPEQVQIAEDTIAKAAKELADPWIKNCREVNVGTFAPQESLNCAMRATTITEFDVCLNAASAPPTVSAQQPPKAPSKR